MPGPFEAPPAPGPDKVVAILERGARARAILQSGVGEDLELRRRGIWAQAEAELRQGKLTPDRALMHVACSNALAHYRQEIESDVMKAQRAADAQTAETSEDGDL